jgi:hypothetical protein
MTELEPYEKMLKWRRDNRYSRAQLAALSGFSISVITDIETGIVRGSRRRPVPDSTMKRYRLCLAAIANGLQDWNFNE